MANKPKIARKWVSLVNFLGAGHRLRFVKEAVVTQEFVPIRSNCELNLGRLCSLELQLRVLWASWIRTRFRWESQCTRSPAVGTVPRLVRGIASLA